MTIKHPDYDIDFKPAIARFDWDQTYDVLEFVYLPQGFSQLMDLCGIPAFELMAIDRFTPYRYRWAEEYSDKVYGFLKAFNFSPHNSINQRLLTDESGALIKDDNGNNITIPNFTLENTQAYSYDPILANFGAGKYQITGLIYQGWQEGLIGSIHTINQAFAEFTLAENTQIDLNQFIWDRWLKDTYAQQGNSNRFCSNSIVISRLSNNGNWVNYTPSFTSKPTWLLFDDITTYFNNVKQQLINYFQTVHNGFIGYFTGILTPDKTIYPLQNYLKNKSAPIQMGMIGTSFPRTWYFLNLESNTTPHFEITSSLIDIDRVQIPNMKDLLNVTYTFDNFKSLTSICSLTRANNNKWKTGTDYNNLGINKYNLRFNIHGALGAINGGKKLYISYPQGNQFISDDDYNNYEDVIFARINLFPENLRVSRYQFYYPKTWNNYEKTISYNFFTNVENNIFQINVSNSCYETERIGNLIDITPHYTPYSYATNIYVNYSIFSYNDWEQLYNEVSQPDQEYLDYLLQLKQQKEAQ